ncbi:hypothetical protein EXIGLDRAFT_704939 [Exidia glandulosa HHB12029]|uniref:Uncharacterized protein n=1 Tax=Exidia glandulosa HHB12029 TaxID=1314781 RepID=A0A165KRG2_EXIGL|nr:hypothetical protein EXIGLDRAFT_704939 [Exidia glandulosa HHB12029]
MRVAALFAASALAAVASAQNWCPLLFNYYTAVRFHSIADNNLVWTAFNIAEYMYEGIELAPISTDRSLLIRQKYYLPEVNSTYNGINYPGRFAIIAHRAAPSQNDFSIKTRCVSSTVGKVQGRQCAGLLATDPPYIPESGTSFAWTLECESCHIGVAAGCTVAAVGGNVDRHCVTLNGDKLALDATCAAPAKFDIKAWA